MAIETTCRGCGKRLRVAEQYAGRQARCPECGYVYTVGNSPPAASQEQPLPAPDNMEPEIAKPASSDIWYLKTPEGAVYGPVSRDELGQWVEQGRVTDDCKLQRGAASNWNSAGAVFPQLAKPQTASNHGNPYVSRPTSSGYASTGLSNTGRYLRPHRGGLIITFAILGWALCPIFSVAAWSMGSSDLGQMRAGLMDREGEGLTQAGQILGMVHVGLVALSFGAFFLLAICGAAVDA